MLGLTNMRRSKTEFAQDCDDFFRAAGCSFADATAEEPLDYSPGELLEVLAPLAQARAAVPQAEVVLNSIRMRRKDFTYSPDFGRAFSAIWTLLGAPPAGEEGLDALATAQSRTLGAMRVYCELLKRAGTSRLLLDAPLQTLEKSAFRAERLAAAHDIQATGTVGPPPRYEVFVSYSEKDNETVTKLKRLLEVVATALFQAKGSIAPGALWREVVFAALRDAVVVLVFWTRNSFPSIEVMKEWVTARRLGKRVVPVLLDHTPLDPLLADYHAVDLRPEDRTGGEAALDFGFLENQATTLGAVHKLLEAISREA